jgi:hypothetical protein
MGKLLLSKKEICGYLKCGQHSFKIWIERGLPARYEDRRWSAHADNIDEFMRLWTLHEPANQKYRKAGE